MMTTEDGVLQNQPAIGEKVEMEDKELLATASGMTTEKHFQVEDNKVEIPSGKPYETTETSSEVESTKEYIAGNLGPGVVKNFSEPTLCEVAGEKSSSSSQHEASRKEEDFQHQEVEVTTKEAVLPGIEQNADEEPRDLNGDEAESTVREETSLDYQEPISAFTRAKDLSPQAEKENPQDDQMMANYANRENETTGEIENLSDFSINVPTETECVSSHSEAIGKNSQDTEIPPHIVILEHETTGNVSIKTESSKEHGEAIKGNPKHVEELLHSINTEGETTKGVEISSDLAENVFTEIECGNDHSEVIEGTSEDSKIRPHDAILEVLTTEKVGFSGCTKSVSKDTEWGSDPCDLKKANMQDIEMLSHSVEAEDEIIEKAGSLSGLARSVSPAAGGSINMEATKEEISKNVEIPGNSLLTPTVKDTSIREPEPQETNHEVKQIDSKAEEVLELKMSDIGKEDASISSSTDLQTATHAEQPCSSLVNALTEDTLLKDAGSEKVEELEEDSGTTFENKDRDTEDTCYTEPASGKEVSDMVPIVIQENQAELENPNKLLEEVKATSTREPEPQETNHEVKQIDSQIEEGLELKISDIGKENASNSSGTDFQNASDAEQPSSALVKALTEDTLLKDAGSEKVQQLEADSGTTLGNEDRDKEDTCYAEPASGKEVSDMVPIVTQEKPAELENPNKFLEEVKGTSTWEPEPQETNHEVKQTESQVEEILVLKMSDIGKENASISSSIDFQNAPDAEQPSSTLVNALTEDTLLKDAGSEKVQELEADSGTTFENEERDKEETCYTEPASSKEVSDMVPIVIQENQAELEYPNKFLEEVKGTSTWEPEPQETSHEVKQIDSPVEEVLELKMSDIDKENASLSSSTDFQNAHDAEKPSSSLINALTEDTSLKDADSEKVEEPETDSGTTFEKEDRDTEDTCYTEPATGNEVSDMVPIITQENQAELENPNKLLKEVKDTSTREPEPQETNHEVEQIDSQVEEVLELKMSDIGKKSASISSSTDFQNAPNAEQPSSSLVNALTEDTLLKDADSEKVEEPEADSGTTFEKEDRDTEDTSYTEPATGKEVPDTVPIITQENQPELENPNKLLEEVKGTSTREPEPQETNHEVKLIDSQEEEVLELKMSDNDKENASISSITDFQNAPEAEQPSSALVNALTEDKLLKDEGSEKVQELVADSGTTFENEDRNKEDTCYTEGKVSDTVPIVTQESQPELENPNKLLEEVKGTSTREPEPQETNHEVKLIDSQEQEVLELKMSDIDKENASISSITDFQNAPEAEQPSSALVNASTEDKLLKDEGSEKVQELVADSGTTFENEDRDKEDTCYTEGEEVSDTVPIVTQESQAELENPNKLLEEVKGTSTWEPEPQETNHEVKQIDSQVEEVLELKMSDIDKENASISSSMDFQNAPHAEKPSSSLVNALTEDTLLEDAGSEKVQEIEADSGTTFENEDRDKEDTCYTEPASGKEVSDMVPIVTQENRVELENPVKFLEEGKGTSTWEAEPQETNHEVKQIDSEVEEVLELKMSDIGKENASISSSTDFQNAPHAEQPCSSLVNAFTEDTVLKDAGLEKVQELEADSGTTFEKEDRDIQENQAELENSNKFQEEVIIIKSTETTMDDAKEGPASSYNDSEMKREGTLQKQNQEQVLAILAGENREDNVVEDLSAGKDKTECPKGEADYVNDDQDIRGNDSEEAVVELNGQIGVEEVNKDTFYEDEKRETHMIDKEKVATENSVEAAAVKENKSDHDVEIEAENPETGDGNKAEAVYSSDDEEIKGSDSKKGARKLKEDQVAEKEAHMHDKVEVHDTRALDKEKLSIEYLAESPVVEENKFVNKATNPEAHDVKGEAFYISNDEESKGNDATEGTPEQKEDLTPKQKEDLTVAEEAYNGTCSKDEEKEMQIIEKEEVATEYLLESSVAEDDKSDHGIKTEATDPDTDDFHKEQADQINDTEEIKKNDPEKVGPNPQDDQIEAKELMQVHKDKCINNEEKEKQLIDKEEETNPEASGALKGQTVYSNIDDEIKVNDSEGGVQELQDGQILAEEAQKDTFRMDKEKEIEVIDKEEVATEYFIEPSVVEENKPDHEVKTEVPDPEADNVHKGKAHHLNNDEEIKCSESEKVEPEPKDQIIAEEVCEDIFSKDEEEETLLIDKEVVTEYLVESSVAEKQKSNHEIKMEATNPEAVDIHESAENRDTVEDKKTENDSQDSVSENTLAEDNIINQIPSQERTEEEFGAEHEFATFSAEEMKKEDNCEESQKGELERETKDLDVEGTTGNDEGEKETEKHEGNSDTVDTKGLTEGLPTSEYQELAENSSTMLDISEERNEKMLNTKESIEIRPVQGSSKQEAQGDVIEPVKETKDLETESTTQNDEATHSAQESEKLMVKQEENADAAVTDNLAEELPPREHPEPAETSSAVPDTSGKSNEKTLETTESIQISSVEGSLKQEELDFIEPEKETKDLDIEGRTQIDEATHSAEEGEENTVKHDGNADVKDVACIDRLAEGWPPREHLELPETSSAVPEITENLKEKILDSTEPTEVRQVGGSLKHEEWKVVEPEKETKDLDLECTTQEYEATHSAQDGEKETVEHDANAAGINSLAEGLPPTEHQQLAKNSSSVPEISEKRKEKMLDAMESIEGSLKPQEWGSLEAEIESKDSNLEGTIQIDAVTNATHDDEVETVKHEENADTTGSKRLAEGLPPREYLALAENSSQVPQISEESNEKLEATELREIRPVEGSLKQEKLEVMDPEKEIKALDTERTTQNDEDAHSAQEGEKETITHEGHGDAQDTDVLAEGSPSRDQELAENFSTVPQKSEKIKEDVLDSVESKERTVEGSFRQEEWDIIEPEEETKDADIEGVTQKDEATNSSQDGEMQMVEHEELADVTGNTASSVQKAEELPPRELKEIAESSSTVSEVAEKTSDSTDIEATGETNVVKNQEVSSFEQKEEMKVLAEEETEDDNSRRIPVPDVQNDICKTLLRDEDDITTEKTFFHDTLQQNAQDPAILPQHEQNPTAEASKATDESLEIFEGSSITMEAILAAEPTEDIEVQKPNVGKEGLTNDNSRSSSENLSPDKQVYQTEAADQVYQTEDSENNQTSSIGEKLSNLPSEDATQVLTEAERADEHEKMTQKIKGGKTLEDNLKSSQEELQFENITCQIGEIKNSNKTTDEASLTEVINQEIVPTNLAVEANDTQLHPSQDPVEATSNEIEKTEILATATDNIQEGRSFSITQKPAEEQKERSGKLANVTALAYQAPLEAIKIDEPDREADNLPDDVKSNSIIRQENDESRLEELHVEDSHEKISAQVLQEQPTTEEREKGNCSSIAERSDLNSNGAAGKTMTVGEIRTVKANDSDDVEECSSNPIEKQHDNKHEDLEVVEANLASNQSHHAAVKEISSVTLSEEGNQICSSIENRRDHSATINECIMNDNSNTAINTLEEEFLQKEGKTTLSEHTESGSFSVAKSSDPDAKAAGTEIPPSTRISECIDNLKTASGTNLEEEFLEKEGQNISKSDYKENSNEAIKQEGEGTAAPELETKEYISAIESSPPSTAEREMEHSLPEKLKDEENLHSVCINDGENTVITSLSHTLSNEFEDAEELAPEKIPAAVPKGECSEEIFKTEETDTSEKKLQTATDEKGDENILIDKSNEIKETKSNGHSSKEFHEEKGGSEDSCYGSPDSEISQNTKEADALEPEIHPRSRTVEKTKSIEITCESAKMPSEDEKVGEPCQDSIIKEKDAGNIRETTRISELQDKDSNSHSGNMNTETKILNEKVGNSEVLSPEIDKESHVQENKARKDSKLNSTSTYAAPPEDNATNTLSLLESETPHYSPNESTCNIGKDTGDLNLEKQEDNAEKAGALFAESSELEQINTTEKREQNQHITETVSTEEVNTKAPGKSLEDEEKEQKVEEQVQFSTQTSDIKLYEKDSLIRKGENADRAFHNKDENYHDEYLKQELSIEELQVEKEELQHANVVSHLIPEPEVKDAPREEILPKAKSRENQDQFNDAYPDMISDLEIQENPVMDTRTKHSTGDDKLQPMLQSPVDKIFQPEIEMLEPADASKAVREKGAEYLESVKVIDDCQYTAGKSGSAILVESSQHDLQQPKQQDVREAPDQKVEVENFQAVGENQEAPKVKPEEEPHGKEKATSEGATLGSMPRETSALSDLLQAAKKDNSPMANDFTAKNEPHIQKEGMKGVKTEVAEYEEPKTDDEGEGDEHKTTDSAYDSPVTVENPGDIDTKAAHKKSHHNILSGVGSKVKHSIAKVKKAITGKSSHPKPPSPK